MPLVVGGLDALGTRVGYGAVQPYLALAAGEHVHIAHLHHGVGKLIEEEELVECELCGHAFRV